MIQHTAPQQLAGQSPHRLSFTHLTTLIPNRRWIQFVRTLTLSRGVLHYITMFNLIKTIPKIKNQTHHEDVLSTNWEASQQCLLQVFFDLSFKYTNSRIYYNIYPANHKISLFPPQNFCTRKYLGNHLLQYLYFTDSEMEAQRIGCYCSSDSAPS